MVTLRSHKIPSPTPKSVPLTPAQTREPPTRQSPPSYKSDQTGSRNRKRNASTVEEHDAAIHPEQNACESDAKDNCLSLRSGKRVVKRRVEYNNCSGELVTENDEEYTYPGVEDKGSDKQSVARGKGKLSEENPCTVNENSNSRAMNELDGNLVTDESQSDSDLKRKKRYSIEEKGKGKLEDDDDNGEALLKSNANDCLQLEPIVKESVYILRGMTTPLENETQTSNMNGDAITEEKQLKRKNETRMDRFHDIARRNASRFAHFNNQEQGEDQLRLPAESVAAGQVVPDVDESEKVEDWPGPFSTAMKIIRDRADKLNSQRQGTSIPGKARSVPVAWVPRRVREDLNLSRAPVPSLQQLCMGIIVKNIDAVTSLEHVPDALRHRLCQMLCDCRKMNPGFFDLLVRGSPTELRVRDCSWMTEEEFVNCFEGCNTSNLTVLQLDKCGRCMPDYVLPATLAKSARGLPALVNLSLSGACRLSDTGLKSLVSSAVALRSINLSQCSLLTSTSIGTLADSLGSVLRELYIDDCQSLDAMHILPALKKLEHLEVLSVAGIPTVCDDFVQQLLVACGHNIKELGLADCTKLTDSSLRVIAESCPQLHALDLVNLRKLTDSALGYLANGCREIQTLKLCRNAFSDDGIAAFVESSGELLKELSLNNVKKVGHNTAISLARRSRNLLTLDLSWCRELTDEAVGVIVDSCLSLRVLKLFGCGQITNVFLNGHSNPEVKIIGLKMSPVLEHLWVNDSHEFPLRYSSVPSFTQDMV